MKIKNKLSLKITLLQKQTSIFHLLKESKII